LKPASPAAFDDGCGALWILDPKDPIAALIERHLHAVPPKELVGGVFGLDEHIIKFINAIARRKRRPRTGR
jgi:hypothetical protein